MSLQLIDSFAWEIGTLKKEMKRKSEPSEEDLKADALIGWACPVSNAIWFNGVQFPVATSRARFWQAFVLYFVQPSVKCDDQILTHTVAAKKKSLNVLHIQYVHNSMFNSPHEIFISGDHFFFWGTVSVEFRKYLLSVEEVWKRLGSSVRYTEF